ncbi:MAG: reverse transcriptase/maturase family protein [Pirellulales bacterium]|nr:reverse transcriptase/maturase family protein [Pirellulales bacterium]
MKRHGGLWCEVVAFENLLRAFRKARRGKCQRRDVERFSFRYELELATLQRELVAGTYQPGPLRTFILHDGKPRRISAAPFRDRVVHHALCNVIEPIFERRFIDDSYASRQGKGVHAAIRRYQQFARGHPYVLKCDVSKFFPSVDHHVLLRLLARKLKDRDVLDLARRIVANSSPALATDAGLRGLPIGNQTSQFFGNVYLDPLDHFVKERLRCRSYLRYVDDFVLLGDDTHQLAGFREAIAEFLASLRLQLHPQKRAISRTGDGLRLLGYRVWPRHSRLTREGVLRARRRLRRYQRWYAAGRLTGAELTQRVRAWLGHALHASPESFRRDLLGDIVFTRSPAD